MSKQRRTKPIVRSTSATLQPDFTTAVVERVTPDLHVEEWLWKLYREAKIAADNFRRQRDEARAELQQFRAIGKVKYVAKKFQPSQVTR